jgi:hypothetical protein
MKSAAVCLFALTLSAQTTVDIGSGSVSETVRQEFVRAYYRGQFQNLTSLPPLGDIKRLGSTGLVQEFPDAAKTNNVRYALVRATSDTTQEGVFNLRRNLHPLHQRCPNRRVTQPPTRKPARPPGPSSASFQLSIRTTPLCSVPAIPTATTSTSRTRSTRAGVRWGSAAWSALNAEEAGLVSPLATGATATVQCFSSGALCGGSYRWHTHRPPRARGRAGLASTCRIGPKPASLVCPPVSQQPSPTADAVSL